MGVYLAALCSMVITVDDRRVDITNPDGASSAVQIHDNLAYGGIDDRDGYLARYSSSGAQPADLEADVQLWADTLGPGDALTSDGYLSAPPPLGSCQTAVMSFYARSESQAGVFGVVRGSIASIDAETLPEPSGAWGSLVGVAVLAAAKSIRAESAPRRQRARRPRDLPRHGALVEPRRGDLDRDRRPGSSHG